MSEFVISTIQNTLPDVEICELTAAITDTGVAITAKSPLIAEFVASKQVGEHRGRDYVSSFREIVFYALPTRLTVELGGNGIYGDMFLSARNLDPGAPRGMMDPNLIWVRAKGLETGVTLVFPQPAHIPADLIEYLNKSMEKVKVFYMKHLRKTVIKSKLLEKFNE